MDLQMLHDVIMHHLETFREETLRTFENVKGRLLLDLFNNHLDVLKYKIDAEWEKIVHVKEEAMELQSQESNTALFEEACSTRNFSNRETVEIHENNDNSCKDDATMKTKVWYLRHMVNSFENTCKYLEELRISGQK